jgi:hypothetical protein
VQLFEYDNILSCRVMCTCQKNFDEIYTHRKQLYFDGADVNKVVIYLLCQSETLFRYKPLIFVKLSNTATTIHNRQDLMLPTTV